MGRRQFTTLKEKKKKRFLKYGREIRDVLVSNLKEIFDPVYLYIDTPKYED